MIHTIQYCTYHTTNTKHNITQVSGSALGLEGQVSVFHHRGGPCYRCVFPVPLAAEAGRRCSDNGVLGTVPGEELLFNLKKTYILTYFVCSSPFLFRFLNCVPRKKKNTHTYLAVFFPSAATE